jgi:hypothetical protein
MKKKLLMAIILLSLISVGLVYAQESGFFLNIINSNANINTVISNSTVIENVTLTNGTLNLNINADNISSVTINGINYTAQQSSSSTPATPTVFLTYYGENIAPEGLTDFPRAWVNKLNNQSAPSFFYTWNLTIANVYSAASPYNVFESALQPLVSKYPQVITLTINSRTFFALDSGSFSSNLAKSFFALYSNTELSSDQINSLTQDLTTQLTPVLIQYYS